ncbi:MAG TPA: hypothetical protein VJ761_21880 [Ktedonobacteraceae bacterium]|nr:hypothetical protein [Ktedonobacteraceae bacterium]
MTTPVVQPAELHIVLEQGMLKIGTCFHCVVKEPGRPDRAWSADGDTELDFDRDQLLARLAVLGVTTEITQEYICP